MHALIEAAQAVIAAHAGGDLPTAVTALEAALKVVDEPHFLLIQEGGSSLELYVHGHESAEQAEDDRADCTQSSYRTSPYVEVPGSLASHPAFYETIDAIVALTLDLDYVEVEESDSEDQGEDTDVPGCDGSSPA